MRPRLVLSNNVGGHTATVLDVDALFPCPGADGHGVGRAGPAGAAGSAPAGGAADLAGVSDVPAEGGAEFLAMPGVKVDLVFSAVQGEADRALGLAAVDVIDKQRRDLLCHAAYSTCCLADLKNSLAGRQFKSRSKRPAFLVFSPHQAYDARSRPTPP